jgi:hypothetical protein
MIQTQYPTSEINLLDIGMLVTLRDDNDRCDYYWIYENGYVGEHKWFLMDNLRCCYRRDENWDSDDADRYLLFPKFLVSSDAFVPGTYLFCDREMCCANNNSIQDFYDFYTESGYYNVELKDDILLLSEFIPHGVPEEIADRFSMEKPVTIKMISKENGNYIRVSGGYN